MDNIFCGKRDEKKVIGENPNRRQWLAQGAGVLAAVALPHQAIASSVDSFPSKPLKAIVPFSPGGPTDTIARTTATSLSAALKYPVVVENRAGAAGIIAGDVVAKAVPDGHTLYIGSATTMLSMQFLFKKIPFDPQNDLVPVSRLCLAPSLLVVNSDLPVRNVQELLDYARMQKGKLSYGSFGIGSLGHLALATLSQLADADMTHIAYKGEAPMTQELLGGAIKIGMASVLSLKQHVASGKLRALAFTGSHRTPAMPDIPTFQELGFKEEALRISGWVGVATTGDTPSDIVNKLGAAVRIAQQQPEVKNQIMNAGFVPLTDDTPQRYRQDWLNELEIYKRLLRNVDLQPT